LRVYRINRRTSDVSIKIYVKQYAVIMLHWKVIKRNIFFCLLLINDNFNVEYVLFTTHQFFHQLFLWYITIILYTPTVLLQYAQTHILQKKIRPSTPSFHSYLTYFFFSFCTSAEHNNIIHMYHRLSTDRRKFTKEIHNALSDPSKLFFLSS